MNKSGRLAALLLGTFLVLSHCAAQSTNLQFEISIAKGFPPRDGRLFVVISRTNNPEPRLQLGQSGISAPQALARDIKQFGPGATVTLDEGAFGYPFTNLLELRPGEYFIQAVFDSNIDIRSPNSPGNLYSEIQKQKVDAARGRTIKLELTKQVPPEQLPPDTELVKFVKIQSKLLTQFFSRPIFLRAGIILASRGLRPRNLTPLSALDPHRRAERPLHRGERADGGQGRVPKDVARR